MCVWTHASVAVTLHTGCFVSLALSFTKIISKINTRQPRHQLQQLSEVPPEGLLETVNKALRAIPTKTITEISKLVYTPAAVMLEMLSYKSNRGRKHYLPWKQQFGAKIEAAWGNVS